MVLGLVVCVFAVLVFISEGFEWKEGMLRVLGGFREAFSYVFVGIE